MRRLLVPLALATGVLIAAPAAAQQRHGSEHVVRAMFDEVWSAGSFGHLSEMLAPDFRFHFRGRTNPMNTEQFQQMVSAWRTMFPDLRFTVEDIVSAGDRTAARLTFTGTHQGTAFGIEPTGRAVSVTMMAFFRFADGRVAELWEDYDEHGLRQQLTRPER